MFIWFASRGSIGLWDVGKVRDCYRNCATRIAKAYAVVVIQTKPKPKTLKPIVIWKMNSFWDPALASSKEGLAKRESPLLSGGVAGTTLPVSAQVLTQGFSLEPMLELLILRLYERSLLPSWTSLPGMSEACRVS